MDKQQIYTAVRNVILEPSGGSKAARATRESARRALFEVFLATMPEEDAQRILVEAREKSRTWGWEEPETVSAAVDLLGTSVLRPLIPSPI